MKYTVIRDTREQVGHGWMFYKSSVCDGTKITKLDTGDYTIEGLEDKFVIERKGTLPEFVRNICQVRFDKELARLAVFPYHFLILEFTYEDVAQFPFSVLPKSIARRTRIRPKFIFKKMEEYQQEFNTQIVLAGRAGYQHALDIFRQMTELYW